MEDRAKVLIEAANRLAVTEAKFMKMKASAAKIESDYRKALAAYKEAANVKAEQPVKAVESKNEPSIRQRVLDAVKNGNSNSESLMRVANVNAKQLENAIRNLRKQKKIVSHKRGEYVVVGTASNGETKTARIKNFVTNNPKMKATDIKHNFGLSGVQMAYGMVKRGILNKSSDGFFTA